MSELDGQRLDVWLYRARFFKTRSLAARQITKGRVRLNRLGIIERVKKSHTHVRVGHEIVFTRAQELFYIEVLALATRRGPAREAATLYQILERSQPNDPSPG